MRSSCDADTSFISEKPEVLLARLFKDDLGVDINPQALRMFIRLRFSRLSPLTHAVHDA